MIDRNTLNDTKELTNSLLDAVNKSSLTGSAQLYCLTETLGIAVSAYYQTKIDSFDFSSKVGDLILSYSTKKQGIHSCINSTETNQ